jgi:ATP-dependent Clp protease ATP-binding subunit ClpB
MTSNLGSHIIQDNFEKITEKNKLEVVDTTQNRGFGFTSSNYSSRIF